MLNQCNFIGRLGADPETRFSQAGTQITTFTLACSEKYKDEEKTEWVRVTTFAKLAEICGEYLQKGSLCFISGKMETQKYQDKDGNDRYSTGIIARDMKILSPRGDSGQQQSGGSYGGGGYGGTGGDVPF